MLHVVARLNGSWVLQRKLLERKQMYLRRQVGEAWYCFEAYRRCGRRAVIFRTQCRDGLCLDGPKDQYIIIPGNSEETEVFTMRTGD